MRYAIFVLSLAILLPVISSAQYPYPYPGARRSGGKANAAPPSGNQPTPTFEGTLKMLTKKEIVLQLQSDQIVTIRRDHKTKFIEKDKDVKPDNIEIGTALAIDVKEDLDLKPMAVRVVVNPPPPPAEKPATVSDKPATASDKPLTASDKPVTEP